MTPNMNIVEFSQPAAPERAFTQRRHPAESHGNHMGITGKPPTDATGAITRPIRHIVLLHGFGSRGANLAPLARQLTAATGVAASSPDAPGLMNGGSGRYWFPLDGLTEENRPARVAAALPDVLRIVRDCVGSDDLADVVVGGFSQGAVLSLEILATGVALGGVLAFSGRFAKAPIRKINPSTPVLIAHGEVNSVVPVACAHQAVEWLSQAGLSPTLIVEPLLGHAVGPVGTEAATDLIGRLPVRS